MKHYFKKYRPFLVFLGKFFFTYFILIVAYQLFLNQFDNKKNQTDAITDLVARQTQIFMDFIGYDVNFRQDLAEPAILVLVDEIAYVRIVEGCNAVSVMILFTAFVVAFSSGFLRTSGFIIAGIVSIHLLNIVRIGILTIGIIKHPQYRDVLHGVIFPLIIYGFVFLLWVIWINKFQRYAKKNMEP